MPLPAALQKLRIPVIGARAGWRDIWSAGQGVGQIDAVLPVAQIVAKLETEYAAARRRLQMN